MHLLELAKTGWNARISSGDSDKDNDNQISKAQVLDFLSSARHVLEIYGPEGDEGGPLDEIETLRKLLSTDWAQNIFPWFTVYLHISEILSSEDAAAK